MTSPGVPDAAVAAMAAVIEDNPFAPPKRLAVLLADEIRRLGYRLVVPTGRPTTDAAEPQEALSGSRGVAPAPHPTRSVNGR